MQKLFTSVLLTVFVLSIGYAQTTLLSENFDNCDLPSGWTINTIGDGPPSWYFTNTHDLVNSDSDGSTIDGSCMVIIDDDEAGEDVDPLTVQFISPAFDATQHSTIQLSVDVHFRYYEESSFSIHVFDGTEFVQLVHYEGNDDETGEQFSEFVRFTADLSFYANPNMQIMLEYDDGDTWAWWAGFDNVLVEGTGEADNLILEDFNDCELPDGWLTQVLTGDVDWQFGFVNNGNTSTTSMNGSCFAYFDDDGLGNEAAFSTVALISPEFDGTQYATFKVDFDVILRRYEDLENLTIGVFDGTDFTPVTSYFSDLGGPHFDLYVAESIDLSAYRAPSMRVVFLYDDGDGWGWWTGIDNVKISGEGAINDLCENAFDVKLNEACLAGDNLTALYVGDQPDCSFRNEGALWYHFQAPENSIIKVSTNAEFNDVITVFEGDCNNLTNQICSNWDEFGFVGETFHFEAITNQSYYIRVSGQNDDFGIPRGDLCIELRAAADWPTLPPNDLCENAIPLEIDGDCISGNNYNATITGPYPSLNTNSRADIWYSFEANTDGKLEILSQANFSDVIALYSGTCGDFEELAVNDYGQKLEVESLTIGETYYVQISGFFATLEGDVCVSINNIDEAPPSNDDCVNALPLTIDDSCLEISSLNATFDGPKPSCEVFSSANVWFQFEGPTSGEVQLNTGAEFVHVVSVYSGTCGDLEELYCIDNPLPCDGYVHIGGLIEGEIYFIQIATAEDIFTNSEMSSLCISLLSGDAMPVPPLNLEVTVECIEDGVGQLNIQANGGEGQLSFQGNEDGEILSSGTPYLVVVTDEKGCEQALSGIISCGNFDCALSAVIATTDVSCNAANNGTAEVQIENANGAIAIEWSNGLTGLTHTNLEPGGYSVTITDETGCVSIVAATIEEPAMLEAQASASGESIFDANDGTVNANPTGGTAPYLFQWDNGSTSQSQGGLEPGTYTVTITDANLCQTEQTVLVEEFECALVPSLVSENISCNGNNDGQASISLQGAANPVSYEWSNGATSTSIENLAPGTYSVTAIDDNNCPINLSVTISQPEVLVSNSSSTNETANGANDGTASLSPQGGTLPYTYLWSNGETTQTINNLAPGNYTATVMDHNGCQHTESIAVNAFNCTLGAFVSNFEDVSCYGGDNGFIGISSENGTAPFTYTLSTGASQNVGIFTGLEAGSYNITVNDASNCETIVNITLEEPNPLSINVIQIEHVDCIGNAIGSAIVSAEGGTPPYSYDWSNGNSGTDQTDLLEGHYSVIVTDGNDCSDILGIDIEVIDNQNPVVSTQNISLELDADGQASISVADINNGSFDNCGIESLNLDITSFDCNDLGENEVILTVLDINGNQNFAQAIVTVEDNNPPTLVCPDNILSTDCQGIIEYEDPSFTDNCGTGDLVLVDGLPSGSEFPLGETQIIYVVTDIAGNTSSCNFIISISNPLMAAIEIVKPDCNGGQDGSATLTVEGGAGTYQYLWDDPLQQTTAMANDLAAGLYTVTIKDENGCEIIEQVLVTEPAPFEFANLQGAQPTCNGGDDGWATIFIEGGTGMYTYLWDDPLQQTTATAINLSAGFHNITVTDENSCSEVFTFQMFEPDLIEIQIDELIHDWQAEGIGAISVTPFGGIPPYTFQWYFHNSVFSFNEDISGLFSGDYALEITDANGCVIVMDTITVEQETATFEPNVDGKIELYPNPTATQVFLELELNKKQHIQLTLSDLTGKVIYHHEEFDVLNHTMSIDLATWSSGVYNLKVIIGDKNWIQKVVLTK